MKLILLLVTLQFFGHYVCKGDSSYCRPSSDSAGSTYNGNKGTTASGKTCQRWDTDKPHKSNFCSEEANYCRNPDNTNSGPWCYTTDANKRWETCGFPTCDTQNAFKSELDALRSELQGQITELKTTVSTLETTASKCCSAGQGDSTPYGSFYTLKDYEGWKLIFKATAGIQRSVLHAWKTPGGCSTVSMNALYADCNHYKSSIVDNWDALGIKKVLLVLATNGIEVKRFEFSGEGTDKMNWFQANKLLSSPYTDLIGNPQFFSIEGEASADRRFYINAAYGGCLVDKGWLFVADRQNEPCPYENGGPFPRFLYSPTTTQYTWQSDMANQPRADVMAIFVQT